MMDERRSGPKRSATHWLSRIAARLGVPVEHAPTDKRGVVDHLRRLRREAAGPLFDDNAMQMMEGALRIADLRARDVMIPKSEWTALRESDSYARAVAVVRESQHSRYPVLDDGGDKVAGILLAKDLLNYAAEPGTFSLSEAMRAPVFAPLSKPLNVLLDEFRRRRNHMVVAVDEYAMPAGIVTIEDVLERIVGEIEDESDEEKEEKIISFPEQNSARVKGGATLEMFNKELEARLDTGEADTVAGWMAARLGHVPRAGETVREGDMMFEAQEADERAARVIIVRWAGRGRRGRAGRGDGGDGWGGWDGAGGGGL